MHDEEEGIEAGPIARFESGLGHFSEAGFLTANAIETVANEFEQQGRFFQEEGGYGREVLKERSVPVEAVRQLADDEGDHFFVAGVVFPHTLEAEVFLPDVEQNEGDDVVALGMAKMNGMAIDGVTSGLIDLVPKPLSFDWHTRLRFSGTADIGDGLQAEDAEDVRVFEKPMAHFADVAEILVGDGVGGGGVEGAAGFLANGADEAGKGFADSVEFALGGVAAVALATALGGVDMDADFGKMVISNKNEEVIGFIEKPFPVGHHHGVEFDLESIGHDASQILDGEEGDFAGGDLHSAAGAFFFAKKIELLLHFGKREGLGFVCVGGKVATGAGEVAALHDVMGGPAGDNALAENLGWEVEVFGKLLPLGGEKGGDFAGALGLTGRRQHGVISRYRMDCGSDLFRCFTLRDLAGWWI